MSDPTGAPDSPETGDADTTSMYGTVPDDTSDDELGTSEEEQLGTETDLTTPATDGLEEG